MGLQAFKMKRLSLLQILNKFKGLNLACLKCNIQTSQIQDMICITNKCDQVKMFPCTRITTIDGAHKCRKL